MDFFFHIGVHKTGSSAIQAFLTLNREVLKRKGFSFPNPPKLGHHLESSGNAMILRELIADRDFDGVQRFLETFDQEENVILSSEALYTVLKNHPDRFFEAFKQYNYKIICYVRRQDNLISSCYNQLIKNHGLTNRSEIDRIAKTHDFVEMLTNCLRYVDADKFIIRPYEKQQFYGGNIFSDFLNCIGLELDDEFTLPEKTINPSFDPDILEFRRLLNVLGVDQNNNKDRDYINMLLADYTIDKNMGRPFQENNIFPTEERIKIIDSYKEKNEMIARTFLGRDQLFYDPPPDGATSQTYGKITLEKALDICKNLLQRVFPNNSEEKLINSIAKGTVDRILNSEQLSNDDIEDKPVVFRLSQDPVNVSGDIATIEKKYDLWFIESIGIDPYFVVPGFVGNKEEYYVTIQITSSTNTVLQIYYLSSNIHFNKDHCISKDIERGYNEFIIKITDSQPIRTLRLDPGFTKGIYLLHTFEVKV